MHVLKPRLTEKAFALSQATNTYVIDVPGELSKAEVARAVTKQFDVKIASVRIVNRPGKVKRTINLTGKRGTNRPGTQARLKKAYVTLAAGSQLPFFAAEEKALEDAAKQAEKSKKTEKKAEKKSVKGAK